VLPSACSPPRDTLPAATWAADQGEGHHRDRTGSADGPTDRPADGSADVSADVGRFPVASSVVMESVRYP